MMILKTMDGNKYKITDDEYKNINKAGNMVHFKSINCVINKNRIEAIYPEHNADKIEQRKNQDIGYLHDGTRVKRYFGQWVDVYNTSFDEDTGKPVPIKFDHDYYPEVAVDNVATEEEYREIRDNNLDYYEYLGVKEQKRRLNSGFSSIGEELLKNKLIK